MLDIDNCRSYLTAANLDKQLAKCPPEWRYVKVWNSKGRHTAVFLASSLRGNMLGPINLGFMVIG